MAERISARRLAFEVLADVEFDDAYANLVMPKRLSNARLEARDAGFSQELAFGTLRWQLFYDEVIEFAAARNLDEIDPTALIVLRLGAHQLLELATPAHAAIAETVDLAKEVLPARLTGFTNAVLRRISERTRNDWMQRVLAGLSDENDRLAVQFSHPVWVVRALRQALKLDGREASLPELLAADNRPPKVSIAALPGTGASDLLAAASGVSPGAASPIGFELSGGDPSLLEAIRNGSARVQDQGSQLAALILTRAEPSRGSGPAKSGAQHQAWADFCAGPGGKAALMAAEAKTVDATLLCNEVTPHRVELVRKAISGLPTAHVEVRQGDGRQLGTKTPGAFDRILLDAPCTGLGALRRRPEARWRKSPRDLDELVALQRELFESAALALKPAGLLAYVTCSPHPAETTAQVDWALKKFDELELVDASAILHQINAALTVSEGRKTVQLWPHVHGTDAMFVALFKKKESKRKAKA